MRLIYIAHQLGNGISRRQNMRNAAEWCIFFAEHYGPIAPVAHWLALAMVWDESHKTEALEIDKAVVARCDEVWLCGGRISPGMQVELDTAHSLNIPVRDWTHLGYFTPTHKP